LSIIADGNTEAELLLFSEENEAMYLSFTRGVVLFGSAKL